MGAVTRIEDLLARYSPAQLRAMRRRLAQRMAFLMTELDLGEDDVGEDGFPLIGPLEELLHDPEAGPEEHDQVRELLDVYQDLRDVDGALAW